MIEIDIKKALDLQLTAGSITVDEYRRRLQEANDEKPPAVKGQPDFNTVVALLKTGELEGADLSRVDWRKKDLSGARLALANLSRAKLAKARLVNVDLAGANLEGVDLTGADLTGANLCGADLSGARLSECAIDGARLHYAKANDLSAVNSVWHRVQAIGAILHGADLARAQISESILSRIDLSDADLSDAKLSAVEFDKANLQRASFQNAQLEKINMAGVDGAEANLNLAAITDVDFTGARLTHADLSNSFLERVRLNGADVSGSIFNVGEHREVDLTEAKLVGASFKSMTGYSEEDISRLAADGAKVDKFYLRHFGRFMMRSHGAQAVAVVIILAIAGGVIYYLRNPNNWSYEKLDQTAQEYRSKSDFARAEELYQIILHKYASNPSKVATARNALANLMLDTRRFDEAIRLFRSVMTDFSDQTSAMLLAEIGLTDVLRSQRKYAEAEQALLDITKRYADQPQSIEAWDRLASLYKLLGRADKAREIYEKIIGQRALDENAVIRAQFDLAQMQQDEGNSDAAIAKYREIIERFGGGQAGSRALSAIIQIEVDRARIERAQQVLDELRSRYPNEADSIMDGEMFIANALLNVLGREDEGLRRLQKVMAGNPGTVNALWAGKGIANYYKGLKRWPEAQALYERLLGEFSDNLRFRYDLMTEMAELNIIRGRPDLALPRLDQVIELSIEPDQIRAALILYAQALAARGDLVRARQALHRLAERFPEDVDARIAALTGEAHLLREANQLEPAVQLLRKIFEFANQPLQVFTAYSEITRIYRESENYAVEYKVLMEMIQRFQNEPQILPQVKMILAENLRLQEKPAEALKLLREVADLNNSTLPVEALNAMVTIYAAQDRMDEVAKIREEIGRRFPNDSRALLNARLETAGLLCRQGKIDAAVTEYNAIAQAGDPSFRMQALSALLQVYAERRLFPEAEKVYKRLIAEFADNRETVNNANLTWASLLRDAGRNQEAEVEYQRVIKNSPGSPQAATALEGMAQMRIEAQDFNAARDLYQRILSGYRNDPEVVFNAQLGLGSIQAIRGELDQAIATYQQAFNMARRNAQRVQALSSMATVYVQGNKLAKAKEIYQHILKQFATDRDAVAEAYMGLGSVAMLENQPDQARQFFRQVANDFAGQSRASGALQALASAEIALNNYTAMEEIIKKLMSEHPDDLNAVINVRLAAANKLQADNKLDAALAQVQWIIARYPKVPQTAWAMHLAAQIYISQNKLEKAREIYNKIIKSFASNIGAVIDAYYGLAEILRLEKKFDPALAAYQDVATRWPNYQQAINALSSMAQIYSERRQTKQEEEIYRRIIKSYATNINAMLNARISLANLLGAQKRYDEALQQFTYIYQNYATSEQAIWAKAGAAQVYVAVGQKDRAVKLFEDIVAHYPADHEVVIGARQFLQQLHESR